MTDVNIATSIIVDAFHGSYDMAMLISEIVIWLHQ